MVRAAPASFVPVSRSPSQPTASSPPRTGTSSVYGAMAATPRAAMAAVHQV